MQTNQYLLLSIVLIALLLLNSFQSISIRKKTKITEYCCCDYKFSWFPHSPLLTWWEYDGKSCEKESCNEKYERNKCKEKTMDYKMGSNYNQLVSGQFCCCEVEFKTGIQSWAWWTLRNKPCEKPQKCKQLDSDKGCHYVVQHPLLYINYIWNQLKDQKQ